MSEYKDKILVSNYSSFGFWLLILFFWGKPDIADGIVHWLMK